jgi:hypothetical protein
MTLPVWPETLPQEAVLGSWQTAQMHAPHIATDMNAGTTRARRRHSLAVAGVQFEMLMSHAQLLTFWEFYFDDIGSGAARFTMPVWNGRAYVSKTVRIKSATGPGAREFSPDRTKISFDLLVESLHQ